ncbi:hypothetical protein HDU79_002845 [Rhizoclosmatium sp. JEL0117]|nr:hypothetical protein HDU79_002845 [Rhizoclosmatium sp. JEL0117]
MSNTVIPSLLPSAQDLRIQYPEATFADFVSYRKREEVTLAQWKQFNRSQWNASGSLESQASPVPTTPHKNEGYIPFKPSTTVTAEPVLKKIASLSLNLQDSPAHSLGGLNPWHPNPTFRHSESHRDRLYHSQKVCTEVLLAVKFKIRSDSKPDERINTSLDLSAMARLIRDVPRNFPHGILSIVRNSAAHVGIQDVPWGSDFECVYRTSQASMLLHFMAKDPHCIRNLTTDEGGRVDKLFVHAVVKQKKAIMNDEERPEFQSPIRNESVASCYERQDFLTVLDLGKQPLQVFVVGFKAILADIRTSIRRTFSELKISVPKGSGDLGSLLHRISDVYVDKQTGFLQYYEQWVKGVRLPGGELKVTCRYVRELDNMLQQPEKPLLSLQVSVCMFGACLELLMLMNTDFHVMNHHWRFNDLMIMSYLDDVVTENHGY